MKRIMLISHLWPGNPQSDNPLSGIYVKEQTEALKNMNIIDVFVSMRLFPSFSEIKKRKWRILQRISFSLKNEKIIKYFPGLSKHVNAIIIALLILIINKKKYNIIHAHTLFPDGMVAYIISTFYKIPYVITLHGSEIMFIHKRKIDRIFAKNILINAQNVICVSEKIENIVLNDINNKVKTTVIRNGIKKMFSQTNKKNNIIFVGKLIDVKDPIFLIDIMKKFMKVNKDFKLNIIGDGILRKTIKREINDCNLQNRIFLQGFVDRDNINEFYENAFCMIITSKSEGFPTIIPEALSAGLPIVSVDVGGIKEIIKDDLNGYIVKNRNIDEFVDKINKCINNKWDRKKIRNSAKVFLWENIAKEITEKVYL